MSNLYRQDNMQTELPLILASASPNRQRLLAEAGFVFDVLPPDEHAEDERRPNELPIDYVRRLALQKAKNTAEKIEQGIVIGGDTIVLCGEDILEKPIDRADARRMLRQLRGQVHQVLSGLCLIKKEPGVETTTLIEMDVTRLVMQNVSDDDLEEYLDTNKWRGKSGSFGYQDFNGWLSILEGSESNVVGLPLELFQMMYRVVYTANRQ
jgi:septum formation protein